MLSVQELGVDKANRRLRIVLGFGWQIDERSLDPLAVTWETMNSPGEVKPDRQHVRVQFHAQINGIVSFGNEETQVKNKFS